MDEPRNNRAGHCEQQPEGHFAFIPKPPPSSLEINSKIMNRLCDTERILGRVMGYVDNLEDPSRFGHIALYKEAALSAQLEGFQVSIADLLSYKLDGPRASGLRSSPGQVVAALNYANTIDNLLPAVADSGLSSLVLQRAHGELYHGIKGRDKDPLTFRNSEIWIGPSGATPKDAPFVPPPFTLIPQLMQDLEIYVQQNTKHPKLLMAALTYYQLETVHPFVDGNGRLARMAALFLLSREGGLWLRFISLASVFGRDSLSHFGMLQKVRINGDWESWIEYFLSSVCEAAEESMKMLASIIEIQSVHRALVRGMLGGTSGPGLALLDYLFQQPLVSVSATVNVTGRTFANTNKLITHFQELGLLTEVTGRRRNRRFCYEPFLNLFMPK